jgi:hypothetical protein
MQSKSPRTARRITTAIAAAGVLVGCCGAHHGHGEPGIGVLNNPKFRSFTHLPIPATNGADCSDSREASPTTGLRPLCATTAWGAACRITGLRPGCVCFEGQAHACDKTTGAPCTLGAPNCGVRACLVHSDTSSSWSACSLL